MSIFIGLFLVVCLNPANHATCTQLPIIDSTQTELTMSGCMGVEGLVSAIKYWEVHTDLHKAYQFGGWQCQVGNKKAPDKGSA